MKEASSREQAQLGPGNKVGPHGVPSVRTGVGVGSGTEGCRGGSR